MPHKEGSLEAPTRHPLDWKSADFWDEDKLNAELERVYDICHGCRRCVSLCNSFPTLFDLVDESDTMEVDGVAKADYIKVVDHCYLCDLCYLTKCPYVPPHEWNVDFPHLMLRAKAVKFKKQKPSFRDRMLSSTDAMGSFMGIPIVNQVANAANKNSVMRGITESVLGIHKKAVVPEYHGDTLRKRASGIEVDESRAKPAGETTGKVALFATCYGNHNSPQLGEDLIAVLQHNDVVVKLAEKEQCCGMPKLELGDLDAVAAAKDVNIPVLAKLVDEGWDIMAPVPSCVLMFKQELPLMFPDDPDVIKVGQAIYDPFEYLMLRHKENALKIEFPNPLGKVAYHVACHQRVQKIGMKTRDVLQLIPNTEVKPIERCSGHDGTYAVKKEYHDISMKICRPVITQVQKAEADHYGSDCPMAG
ncbi:MAG: heterodisulfide reductase-related iron-sulfur binding cluster, partial [Gammaproteobacteria bacterium]|nr:heterodisulfide reductase-related iron-sulfur binding cluster [Gammaproteobacteria bacterium]